MLKSLLNRPGSISAIDNKNTTAAKGFTLLEVIVIISIGSIMGLFLVQLLGTNMYRSAKSIVWAKEIPELTGVMEKITADYEKFVVNDDNVLTDFQSRIEDGNVDSNTPYYGDYNIEFNDFIWFDPDASPPYSEAAGGTDLLKVTISKGDHNITALFTE